MSRRIFKKSNSTPIQIPVQTKNETPEQVPDVSESKFKKHKHEN